MSCSAFRARNGGLWRSARGKRTANAAEPTRDELLEPTRDELLDVVQWQNWIIDMISRDRNRLAGIAASRVIPRRGQGKP